MKTWDDFTEEGLNDVTNDHGEVRNSRKTSIVFPNKYVASILVLSNGYSVAACDWNGYFWWEVFDKEIRSEEGGCFCKNEDEVCVAIEKIAGLPQLY